MSCPKGLTQALIMTQPEKQRAEGSGPGVTHCPSRPLGFTPRICHPQGRWVWAVVPRYRVGDTRCSHTLRARLGQGARGVSHPVQPPGATRTQPSGHVTTERCPRKSAPLELTPPLQARTVAKPVRPWGSGSRRESQCWPTAWSHKADQDLDG